MSLNITIYGNFGKRINSTKTPQAGEGTDVSVTLKEETDVNNPIFMLSGYNAYLQDVNYVKWGKRYYFCKCKAVSNSTMHIICNEDYLASWKAEIIASSQIVAFANLPNTELSDGRLPSVTSKTFSSAFGVFDVLGAYDETNPTVVFNVTGNNNSVGAFALDMSTAKTLLNRINNWYENDIDMPTWGAGIIQDQLNALIYLCNVAWHGFKQLFATGKVSDSIRSAFIIPIPLSSMGGSNQRIWLGDYDTNVDGQYITDRIFADGCDVDIPWPTGDWRRNEPYTEIYLYLPYVGDIKLSNSDLVGETSIHISFVMDRTDGTGIFTVKANTSGQVLGQYTANLGVPFGVGMSNVTPIQTATSLASASGGVAALLAGATGAGAVASFGAIAFGIGNTVTGSPTTISQNGGGAILGLNSRCTITIIFHDTNVAPSAVRANMGEPLYQPRTLSTLTGYCQCVSASVLMNGNDEEKNAVNEMLNSGFFIE